MHTSAERRGLAPTSRPGSRNAALCDEALRRSGQRSADRRSALRPGGRGRGECSPTRGFRVAAPVWWCDPWRCADLKSPTLYAIQRVRHASRVSTPSRPVARCDPAGGSRTGGALRRVGGGDAESAGLMLADGAFQGCCPIWCAIY